MNKSKKRCMTSQQTIKNYNQIGFTSGIAKEKMSKRNASIVYDLCYE